MVEAKQSTTFGQQPNTLDLPSNKDIGQVVDSAKRSLNQAEAQANLDVHGRVLVSDIQSILNSSKKLMYSLNSNDQLQKFINDIAEFTQDYSERLPTDQVRGDVYDALHEGRELLLHSKDLVLFIIRSGEFRQFMYDLIDLFKGITSNIQDKYQDEGTKVKDAVKSDINREDTSASKTQEQVKKTGQKVKEDIQQGTFVDDDKKEQLRTRLNSLMDRFQRNKDFNLAIKNFYRIIDLFNRRFDQLKNDPNLKLEGNDQFEQLVSDAKGILSNIFGDKFADFDKEFWSLASDLREDKEAQKFFSEFRSFINDCIDNADKWDKDEAKDRLNKMVDRIMDYWDTAKDNYGDRLSQWFNWSSDMISYSKKEVFGLQDQIYKLVSDAVFDRQGRPDLYVTQDTLKSLQDIIVPIFQQQISNIPIPTISGSTETYDFSIHDVLLDGRGFIPDRFRFRFVTDLVLDSKHSRNNQLVSKILCRVDGIDMDLKNVHFHYARKSIPRIEDSGVCDVSIRGLSLKLSWYLITQKDGPTKMKLVTTNSLIESMSISNIISKHSWIDGFMSTFAKGYIKEQVQKGLIESLKSYLDPISDQVNYYLEQQWNNYKWNKDRWIDQANWKLKGVSEKASDTWQEWSDKSKDYKEIASDMVKDIGDKAKDLGDQAKESVKKTKKSDVWGTKEWEQKWHNHDV
jgi:hypothetical protein